MPAAIHMAHVSNIPGAMSPSDLRPAGRNLCARTSASRSTKLAIAKRPKVNRRLSGSRPGAKCNTAVAASVEAEEVARVAVPARRGRPELALGTIGGTIVHFAGLNAGVIALVKPLNLGDDTTHFYLPVAAISPAILAAVLLVRKRLGRLEGAALIALYVAYVGVAVAIST